MFAAAVVYEMLSRRWCEQVVNECDGESRFKVLKCSALKC